MHNQVISNLAVEIANLHVQLATEQAKNAQLQQQLSQQSENEDK